MGPARRGSTRAREEAELARVCAQAAAVPSLTATVAVAAAAAAAAAAAPAGAAGAPGAADRALLQLPPRPNRRQRQAAAIIAAAAAAAATATATATASTPSSDAGAANSAGGAAVVARSTSVAMPAAAAALVFPPPARRFADLPLSTRTLDGLAAARFVETTEVQRVAIPQALAGRDVLAAAPTGSGKTLAFVVPLLEALWRNKWSTFDGLGALVLAPTRELALQIFDVVRTVGKQHQISAGLVIGGKDFEYEREKVGRMNILVATPGRMLHHMDHVADLDCSALKMLVLDEADRILDMGFAKTLDAILQNLPRHDRQTLLFSATQTKSVKALARLSLRSPEYVSVMSSTTRGNAAGTHPSGSGPTAVGGGRDLRPTAAESHEKDAYEDATGGIRIAGTPRGLSQSYAVIEPHEKLSVLWSFIKTHLGSKVIVFFATGKQVRFTFEAFCKLRPGIPLLHIHGHMKQMKRTEMYDQFCKSRSAVLFATDVASRGLDFPNVEWVVQVDCPDDVGSYVHRVGRTARFTSNGRAMLLLSRGSEETFLTRLESQKLHLNRVRINPERTMSISQRIAALSASNQELKKLGQRAFTFYLKSVLRQQDKQVFNAVDIDHAALAKSFGLSLAPRVSFKGITTGQIASAVANLEEYEGDRRKSVFGYRPRPAKFMDEGMSNQDPTQKTTVRSMKNPDSQGSGEGEDVLILKRVHPSGREDDVDASGTEGQLGDAGSLPVQQRPRKRLKLDVLKSGPSLTNRIVFTDDGRAVRASELVEDKLGLGQGANPGQGSKDRQIVDAELPNDIEEYAAMVAKRLAITSEADKYREHGRVRVKHAKQRDRGRGRANPNHGNGMTDVGDKEDLLSDDCVSSESSADEFDDALARIAAGAGKGFERDDDMNIKVRNDDNTGLDTDACDVRSQEELALRILAQRGL